MASPDLDAIVASINQSKNLLDRASLQGQQWAQAAIGVVQTDTGPVPTIGKFIADNQARADVALSSLGYEVPVAYAAGLSMVRPQQTVVATVGGEPGQYAPLLTALPFVTSGTFETSKFYLIQGATKAQIAAPTFAGTAGFDETVANPPGTIGAKLREIPSLQDKAGAKGDFVYTPNVPFDPDNFIGTNNVNALAQWALAPAGDMPVTVKIPFLPGQTNGYLFSFPSGFTINKGTIILDVDEGVTLYVYGVALNNAFVRPAKVVNLGLKMAPDWSSPSGYDITAREVDKAIFLTPSDAMAPQTRVLTPTSDLTAITLPWPNGGFDNGGVAGDVGYVNFGSENVVIRTTSGLPGDGAIHAAGLRLRSGEELATSPQIASGEVGGTLIALVRTSRGMHGLMFGGGGSNEFNNNDGSTVTQEDVTPFFAPSHASYYADQGRVSIRLKSPYRYQVMTNGYVLIDRTLDDPIVFAGFGCYIGGAMPVGTTFGTWEHTVNKTPDASTLMGVITNGDSISQATWPQYARAMLEGTAGIRVVKWLNLAVAGEDAQGQLVRLQALGDDDWKLITHAAVQLGVNNIQNNGGGSNVAAYVSAMTQIFDIYAARKVKVVALLPTLFYSRALAGGMGQDTRNYGGGTPYRDALVRLCASRKIPLLNSLEAYGPIIGDFLTNPLINSRNPFVVDNIHNGYYGNLIMGHAAARMLLGTHAYVATSETPWTPLYSNARWPVQNGWSLDGAAPNEFKMLEDGRFTLRGTYNVGTRANGTSIHQLGGLAYPRQPVAFQAYTDTFEPVMCVLTTGGLIQVYGMASTTGTKLIVDTRDYSLSK